MSPTTHRGPVWLFVPGDRPDRFEKARQSGANEVICDLEDAVTPDLKGFARNQVAAWLGSGGAAWVRVNQSSSPWHDADLAVIATLTGLRGVIVPKAETVESLETASHRLGSNAAVIALIETALGLERVRELVTARGVERLAFGSVDFALDIDADELSEPVDFARSTIVLASRCAGKAGPLDGVTTVVSDNDVVQAAARRSRSFGFAGKLAIHPSQVQPIEQAFRPTDDELMWARDVSLAAEASPHGAFAVDGALVDMPIVERARRILRLASGAQSETDGTGA